MDTKSAKNADTVQLLSDDEVPEVYKKDYNDVEIERMKQQDGLLLFSVCVFIMSVL
jgi:hypothetical protein